MAKSKGWGSGGRRGRPFSYSAKYRVKSKSSVKTNYDHRFVKAHYHRVKTKKEETGKEILERIIRELNANIRRKEREQEIRRKS